MCIYNLCMCVYVCIVYICVCSVCVCSVLCVCACVRVCIYTICVCSVCVCVCACVYVCIYMRARVCRFQFRDECGVFTPSETTPRNTHVNYWVCQCNNLRHMFVCRHTHVPHVPHTYAVFCPGNIEWWLTSLGSRSKRKTRNYTSLYNAQYACAHARARLELSPPTNLIVLYSAHSDSI